LDQGIFKQVEALYGELPVLNCKGCGECCVSPTCTFAEALYLFGNSTGCLTKDEQSKAILSKPVAHHGYNGSLVCSFLSDKRCLIHPYRTGGCRLFGIPELSDLNIESIENCNNGTTIISGPHDTAFLMGWLDRMVKVNEMIYDTSAPPYLLRGLNLFCWLDLYFDTSLTYEPFAAIRKLFHETADFSDLNDSYLPSTGIKEKIDKITLLDMMLESGDRTALMDLAMSIRDDYPLTGTYYFEESQLILKTINEKK